MKVKARPHLLPPTSKDNGTVRMMRIMYIMEKMDFVVFLIPKICFILSLVVLCILCLDSDSRKQNSLEVIEVM